MKIAVIDLQQERAAQIADTLRQAGHDEVVLIGLTDNVMHRLTEVDPDAVLIDLDAPSRDMLEQMFDLFSNLKERQDVEASVLSGGEKQMLTICRTLMGNPSVIMVDEPTEGLAPKIVERVGELLEEIAKRGVSILLVEQKLTIAMKISSRVYVMGHGHMVFEGSPQELEANEQVRKEWLEV